MIRNRDMIMTFPIESFDDEYVVLGLTLDDILFLRKCAEAAGLKPPYNTDKNSVEVKYDGKTGQFSLQESASKNSI